jgi:hypothetical protein
MAIANITDLKKVLVNEIARYFNEETVLSDMTMTYLTPRKGYDYGVKLMHARRRTILKFYLMKGKVFYLDRPTRMITRPKVVGIGDESLVFIGVIDLDIPDLSTLLPSS